MISMQFVTAIKVRVLHIIWMISKLNHTLCDAELKCNNAQSLFLQIKTIYLQPSSDMLVSPSSSNSLKKYDLTVATNLVFISVMCSRLASK